MRWPLDKHQTNASHRMPVVFGNEAEISAILKARLEPISKSGIHCSDLTRIPASFGKHRFAVTAYEIEVFR
ncbi:hypothetical protein ATY75_04760 [Rhizobium sp. N122]|nr:hypothetical protein ATY75_04760 [Rhizobium sp. N122]